METLETRTESEINRINTKKFATVENCSVQLDNESQVQVRTCDILNFEGTLETRVESEFETRNSIALWPGCTQD